MAPPKKKYHCLVCNEEITGKTGSVECSFCEKWVHPKCGNISKAHLEILLASNTTYWTCDPCHAVAGKIKKEIRQLQSSQDQLRKEMGARMDSLKEDQDAQKVRMDSFEKQLGLLNKEKNNNDAVYKEMRDRENRRENLVIHQIPEAPISLKGGERKEFDASRAMELFEFIGCAVRREDIKFIYRPGETTEPNRPRPVILSLQDEAMKKHILSNTRKLAGSKFDKVSIIPDLTPQQRKEEDDLRHEVIRLNDELDSTESLNWEWVLVGPRGRRRLIKRRKLNHVEGPGRGRGGNWRGREPRPAQPSQSRDYQEDMNGIRATARGPLRGNRGGRGRGSGSMRGQRIEETRPQDTEMRDVILEGRGGGEDEEREEILTQEDSHPRAIPPTEETDGEEDTEETMEETGQRMERRGIGGEKRLRGEASLSPPLPAHKKKTTPQL